MTLIVSKTDYAIAPEFQRLPSIKLGFSAWSIALLNVFLRLERWFHRPQTGTTLVRQQIVRTDGSTFEAITLTPANTGASLPCLIYFHGGGFAMTYGSTHIAMAQHYAKEAHCCVVFVKYRLMPKHPFPAGQNDCYTALQWASDNADKLGIDKQRIAVGGDSAGGALAASVCQMNRDRDGLPVCGQLLVYPVIDAECKTPSATEFTDTPIWTSASNTAMWRVYLRNYPSGEIPAYASPIHGSDLAGLPPAYVETAQFDPLRDEGIDYATRLQDAGVTVELNQTQGTVHGFDAMGNSPQGSAALTSRIHFLRRCFAPQAVDD